MQHLTEVNSTDATVRGAPIIEFDSVSLVRDGRGARVDVLDRVNFSIEPGEFIAIVGPSGCGKTTMLNLLAGLLQPSKGSVRHLGITIDKPNNCVGYLTQTDDLLPWRTAFGNLALPLELQHVPRAERTRRCEEMLERLGLRDFRNHHPAQLSGGMRKRLALGRTLIYNPETLLLDEPFSALDLEIRLELQQQLIELVEERGTTAMLVTHDLSEAVCMADRIIIMSQRPSNVKATRDVALPHPRQIDEMRFLPEIVNLERSIWEEIKSSSSRR